MSHLVSGIQLVPQTQSMSCWYACSLMLQRWYQGRYHHGAVSPELSGHMSSFYSNTGMRWVDWPSYARAMGFQTIPAPATAPDCQTIERWLQSFGPIILLGTMLTSQGHPTPDGHALVIAGIEYETRSAIPAQMYIYDPWRPNIGYRGFHPFSWLSTVLSTSSNAARQVSFVHYR